MRARTLTLGLGAVIWSAGRACVGIAIPPPVGGMYRNRRENRLGQTVKI
jgi:hypothetical protein